MGDLFHPLVVVHKRETEVPFPCINWFGQFIATKPPFGHPKWCFSKGIFNYRLVDVGGSKDVLMCISFWRMIVKFIKRLDYFAAGRPSFESTSYIRLYGLWFMLFWGCLMFVFPWLTDFCWLPRTWEVLYWMHDRHGSMDERGHDPFWKKERWANFLKKGPWLFRVCRGLYYPAILGLWQTIIRIPIKQTGFHGKYPAVILFVAICPTWIWRSWILSPQTTIRSGF